MTGLATGAIRRVMAANRGEIAIRIFRAATELNMETVAIYSKEDIRSVHRYKADESYMLSPDKGPVAAYLAVDDVVRIAKEQKVDAIHPGYGFLSESVHLATACEHAGIRFVGPTSKQLQALGDKTQARAAAINAGLPVVGGSPPLNSLEDAHAFLEGPEGFGYPVIIKAAMGGGGRGIRIARNKEEFNQKQPRSRHTPSSAAAAQRASMRRHGSRHSCSEAAAPTLHCHHKHLYPHKQRKQRTQQRVRELASAAAP